MAWMNCQFLLGLKRLGHEVFYIEATKAWPYDPVADTRTNDPAYTLSYMARVLERFGLGRSWAYRATYADRAWHGPLAAQATEVLSSADAVLNIAGATLIQDLDADCRLVHIGTDPVVQELRVADGDARLKAQLAAHVAHFTYGENIGRPDCPVPPFAEPMRPMRQPIVLDYWTAAPPPRREFTTITNWRTTHHDISYKGELYTWDKAAEFLKFIDVPHRARVAIELAMGGGVAPEDLRRLHDNGWQVIDGVPISLDPWPYRDYILNSRAEFTVAKDMNVRLKSGWFSERSACYLAAGRPVVTQDTGFGRVLPTGEGLFAFNDTAEIIEAIAAIQSDYDRHSRAALAIAEDCFRAETVLGKVLKDLGL